MSDTPETPAAPTPSEPVSTPAPESSGQPAAQPSQPATDPAASTPAAPAYSDDQVNAWKRESEMYRGSKVLTDPLIQRGLKTQDDLKPLLDLHQTASERGLDLGQLATLLKGQQPQAAPAADGPVTTDSIRHIIGEQFAERDEQVAMRELTSASAQMSSLMDSMRGELATTLNLSKDSLLLDAAIASEEQAALSQNLYPTDHPLHSKYNRPLDSQQIAAIKDRAAERVRQELTRMQVAQAQAQQRIANTPAQPSGGGLQSNPSEPAAKPRDPFGSTTQEDINRANAIFQQVESRRSGGVPANTV